MGRFVGDINLSKIRTISERLKIPKSRKMGKKEILQIIEDDNKADKAFYLGGDLEHEDNDRTPPRVKKTLSFQAVECCVF